MMGRLSHDQEQFFYSFRLDEAVPEDLVVKGGGYGLIGDIVVGIIGALIAGWLLPQIGIVIGGGIIAAIINAFIGAVILLIILRLIKRAA